MNFVSWEISVIAFLPAIFLCGYIYYKDRIEKEPIGLLLLLFGLGGAAYIPTLMLEKLVNGGIDKLFASSITYSPDGLASYSSSGAMILHKALCAFIGIALIECAIKWLLLYFCTRNNRHFNYMFDGIVYSVFVSLGFAAIENIRFAWINGWDMLVLRSLASIPYHLIIGIVMGYFYSLWNARRKARDLEEKYVADGVITEQLIKRPIKELLCSSLIPYLVSAIYVLSGSTNEKAVNAIFYFAVFSLYGISFVGIERIAAKDKSSRKFSMKILQEKHPGVDFGGTSALEEKSTSEEAGK